MKRQRGPRLHGIAGFSIDRVADAAGADPEILRLENLDTDIPPPRAAIEATRAALGDLGRLRDAVTDRTRVMFLMNPSIPSGAVMTREDWEEVARLCEPRGIWLLYNAAMERILYGGRPYVHPASVPGLEDLTITVGSVSKEYRMIGWRVGWVAGPRRAMNRIGLVSIYNVVTPVGIAQPGALAALTDPAGGGVAEAVREWERRRDVVQAELAALPFVQCDGGWSLLVDTGKLGLDGEAASARLLERGKVAATPMTHWGRENAGQYVRIVFSNEPVERLRGLGERFRRAM